MLSAPARPWVLVLVAVLMVPSVGPLIDHHFTERNPGHRHVGVAPKHGHTFGRSHVHDGGEKPPAYPTAVFNLDGGPASPTTVVLEATHLGYSLRFEPSSFWLLMVRDRVSFQDHYTSPPKRPPQPLAQAFARAGPTLPA